MLFSALFRWGSVVEQRASCHRQVRCVVPLKLPYDGSLPCSRNFILVHYLGSTFLKESGISLLSFFFFLLTVLSEKPTTFTITVTSEAGENDETVQTTLKFTYREKYPDETPLYEIVSQENLDDNDVADIIKLLEQQAEENLGMVMIFTLVSAVQEKLNEIVDQIKTRREEEKKQKEREAEEEEKQRFHGTPVTIENFLNWKAKFDAELLEIKRKKMKEEEQAGKNKLSGKQLFEMDHNLDTSDIQFLEEAGNSVEVDESLFQEMDDLELEDEEDDPDYNPVNLDSD
ncbi:PREDICTED: RWD domain-containing protein 1 [Charadrius vociferus]|nr:PREDICTED: RWD domain-containing protein 1 [Charadrius vociferus]